MSRMAAAVAMTTLIAACASDDGMGSAPDGKMQDLGTLPGDFLSFPGCCNTINDSGQIVGNSIGPNGPRGVLWHSRSVRNG